MSPRPLPRGGPLPPGAPPLSMVSVELRHTSDGHYKFYLVDNVGRRVFKRWGRIGTWGQTAEHECLTAALALQEKWALIAQKVSGGYRAVSSDGFVFVPDCVYLEAVEMNQPARLHSEMSRMARLQRGVSDGVTALSGLSAAGTQAAAAFNKLGGALTAAAPPEVIRLGSARLPKPHTPKPQLEELAPRRRITFGRRGR